MANTFVTWPDTRVPAVFDWRLDNNDGSFRSPLNGYQQDLGRTGAAWAFSVSWPALTRAETRVLSVWLMQLKKAGYRTRAPLFAYEADGVLTGTPLVNGASQTGLTLVTDGWSISVTKIAALGDFIQLATGQLIRLTADANSDGSGNATLAFEPPLRTSPANNSALTVLDPRAAFKISTAQESFPQSPGGLAALSLDFIEDIFAS